MAYKLERGDGGRVYIRQVSTPYYPVKMMSMDDVHELCAQIRKHNEESIDEKLELTCLPEHEDALRNWNINEADMADAIKANKAEIVDDTPIITMEEALKGWLPKGDYLSVDGVEIVMIEIRGDIPKPWVSPMIPYKVDEKTGLRVCLLDEHDAKELMFNNVFPKSKITVEAKGSYNSGKTLEMKNKISEQIPEIDLELTSCVIKSHTIRLPEKDEKYSQSTLIKRLLSASLLGIQFEYENGHRYVQIYSDPDRDYNYKQLSGLLANAGVGADEGEVEFCFKVYGGIDDCLDNIDLILKELGHPTLLEMFTDDSIEDWGLDLESVTKENNNDVDWILEIIRKNKNDNPTP